jgi:hypothetical protein
LVAGRIGQFIVGAGELPSQETRRMRVPWTSDPLPSLAEEALWIASGFAQYSMAVQSLE